MGHQLPSMIRIIASMFVLLVLAGCQDSIDAQAPVKTITATSYNLGLALNFVPYTNERLVVLESLIDEYDSDVICMQEVWRDEQVEAIRNAISDRYSHVYTVPPEQIISESAACTVDEIARFEGCARAQCDGLTGNALVGCGTQQCGAFFGDLSPPCFDGVIGAVGTPGITIDGLVEVVTQPAGKFAYDGSLGLMLASKHELINREFLDFIDDSSGNHRGALFAEIRLNNRSHVIGCTHPTANLGATIDYPTSGKHGSWEGENRFMQQQMIAFANAKAGDNPIIFGGDFNCSFGNASNAVDPDFEENCQLWLADGFLAPAAEQLPCTFCADENLILLEEGDASGSLLLDHLFVKNLDPSLGIKARRIFDQPVAIEALVPESELSPEDSPKLTHPSDHFGIEVDIELE